MRHNPREAQPYPSLVAGRGLGLALRVGLALALARWLGLALRVGLALALARWLGLALPLLGEAATTGRAGEAVFSAVLIAVAIAVARSLTFTPTATR